jgi:tellurite resistance protein
MESTESRACLRILLAVARADGHVDQEEARALEVLGELAYGSAAPRKTDAVDLEAEIAAVRSPGARRTTFEAAVALAELDGKCTPEEHRLLERLQRAFALDTDLELGADEAKWSSTLREPRKRLATAESEFLRTVADLQAAGDLSEPRYEQLVAGLRARRAAVLEGALSGVVKGD